MTFRLKSVRRALAAGFLILVVALISPAHAAAQDGPLMLLLTADTEGHLDACRSCPSGHGLGGLAPRATLVSSTRRDAPATLLLDAGNFLIGPQSLSSDGEVIAAAYRAMTYDAVNLTHRDLALGLEKTMALINQSTLPAVSANLLDEKTNQPLVKPFIVVTTGGRRVAVIGVTDLPQNVARLPHVRRQLKGVRIDAIEQALGTWLPKANAESDLVILLYYGSAANLKPIREKFGGELAAVLVGGARPQHLPPAGAPAVIGAADHGTHVARARLGADGKVEAEQVPIHSTLAPDPAMVKLLATYQKPRGLPEKPDPQPPATVAEEPVPTKQATVFGLPIGKAPPAKAAPAESAVAPTRTDTTPSPDKRAPREVAKLPVKKSPETRVTAKQSRTPKGLAGVGLTPEQVNRAIDTGSDFLWKFIKEEGITKGSYKLGDHQEHGLACLALVHAGAHKRLPDFDAELRGFLTRVETRKLGVYEAGVLCMLIESYGDPALFPKLRQAARSILENQGPEGSWNYGKRFPEGMFEDPAQDRPLQASGGVPLEGPGAGEKPWARLTPWKDGEDGDNSVSQYALLGLHAASRCGIPLPQETWKRSLEIHRKRQNKDGGWGYTSGSGYGSMTCAGICALAINRHELGGQEPWDDEGIERGLAWMAPLFTVTENIKYKSGWHFYYLYSLERVGRLLDTEFIGEHEWYPIGARYLVDSQEDDGRWVSLTDSNEPRLPTSFALLFLTRATPTLGEQLKRGGEGTLKTAVVVPSNRIHIILDCSGSMLGEMNGRQKFQIAKDAVAHLIQAMPDDAEVGLRVYGHRKRALEDGANEDVELLIPIGKLDRDSFLFRLDALRARGKTPLALSLREAKKELAKASKKEPVTVVLLTDGGEDTLPRQDPLKAAEEFATLTDVRLHVVGFDIGRKDWTEQLLAMTARAGGRYYAAADEQALLGELRASVFGAPSGFTVLDSKGQAIADGPFRVSKLLPEGQYILRARFADQTFEEPFWINTQRTTVVTFDASRIRTATGAPEPTPAADVAPQTTDTASPQATTSKKFCTACGQGIQPSAKFCSHCGAKVGSGP